MKDKIFVVSDIHGIKKVYDTITNYLDEVALCNPEYNIKLIINGDIIDRGPDSIEILEDIIERQNNQKGYFQIDALAGNHELMMYEALQLRDDKLGWYTRDLSWFNRRNGAGNTIIQYDELDDEKKHNIISFLNNLELQKTFDQAMLDTKGVIVAHAHASSLIKYMNDQYNIKYKLEDIKDEVEGIYLRERGYSNRYYEIMSTVWDRKNDVENLGLRDYTTIIGHTPVNTKTGYEYDQKKKVLNIDGRCASYAFKLIDDVTVPLVELDFNNKQLIVNRFNIEGNQLDTHIITEDGISKEKSKVLKI